MQPVPEEQCPVEEWDQTLYEKQRNLLDNVKGTLKLRALVDGAPRVYYQGYRKLGGRGQAGSLYPKGVGCQRKLTYREPGQCYSKWSRLHHCNAKCQLDGPDTCDGQVDCKFCCEEEEEDRQAFNLRLLVARKQLNFDQLAQVEVAMAPLMDRPLKRRRLYACAECPAVELPAIAPPKVDFFDVLRHRF
jgi:hypothetical protein